jgi:hypothetical protein
LFALTFLTSPEWAKLRVAGPTLTPLLRARQSWSPLSVCGQLFPILDTSMIDEEAWLAVLPQKSNDHAFKELRTPVYFGT